MSRYFVISSPSGGGKTTLIRLLLANRKDLYLVVSCTTRPPRASDADGVDYRFISEEDFKKKIDHGEFLEWEEVHGFLYGTPREELKGKEGKDLIFDVDTRGALSIKGSCPNTTLVFVEPPSFEILEERLKARGTEDYDARKRRLENFRREVEEKNKFDYVIVNDEISRAVARLDEIIRSVRGGADVS